MSSHVTEPVKENSITELTLIGVLGLLIGTPLFIFVVSKLCCNIITVCSGCTEKDPKPLPRRKKSFSSLCTDSKADSGFSEKVTLVDETESGRTSSDSYSRTSPYIGAAATLLAVGRRGHRRTTHSESSSRSDLSSLGSPVEFDENYPEIEMKEMRSESTEDYTPAANRNQGATSSTYCEMLQEELSSHDVVPAAQPIEWQSYGLASHGPAFASSDTSNQSESIHEDDMNGAHHTTVDFHETVMNDESEVPEFTGSNSDNTMYEE